MVMFDIVTQVSGKVQTQPRRRSRLRGRRRRVAEGKGGSSNARLKEAGGKSAGRRIGMPRTPRG